MERIAGSASVLALCAIFALAALSGCGGGGGSASGTGGTGSTGGAGSLTPDQRDAVRTLVQQKFDSLHGVDVETANSQLVAFLQGRPEFEAAGTVDDSVWARYKDGGMMVIVNDHLAGNQPKASPRPAAATARAFTEVPKGTTARLFNTSSAANGWYDITPQLKAILGRAGYTVSVEQGTLDDYKRVTSADGESVLFTHTHGGYAVDRSGNLRFGIWTATPDTLLDWVNSQSLADYYAGRTIEMLADPNALDDNQSEWHWTISDAFVTQYMKFVPHRSFWYLQSCNMGRALGFQTACFQKGLSVFAGWTAPTYAQDTAAPTLLLFDRLAGANVYQPESPPQRPFDLQATVDYLKSKGLTHVGLTIPGLAGGADLKITYDLQNNSSNEFGLLAPTIQSVAIDLQNKLLTLGGDFGSDSTNASVSFNGAPLQVQSYAWSEIKCALPAGALHGGPVAVTVNGIRSNSVYLMEWNVPIHYVQQFGGATCTVDMKVHLLGNVYVNRSSPGQAIDTSSPQKSGYTGSPLVILPDSTVTSVTASGSYHQYLSDLTTLTGTVSWSPVSGGAVPISYGTSSNSDRLFSTTPDGGAGISLDQNGNLQLTLNGNLSGSKWINQSWTPSDPGFASYFTPGPVGLEDGGALATGRVVLPVDNQFNIVAGSKTTEQGGHIYQSPETITVTWSWDQAAPSPAYDPNATRAAAHTAPRP